MSAPSTPLPVTQTTAPSSPIIDTVVDMQSEPSTPLPVTQTTFSYYESESPCYAPSSPIIDTVVETQSEPSTSLPVTQTTLSYYESESSYYAPSTPIKDTVVSTQSTHSTQFIDLTSEDDEDEAEDERDPINASPSNKRSRRADDMDIEGRLFEIQKLRKIIQDQEKIIQIKDKIIQSNEEIIQTMEEAIQQFRKTIKNDKRIIKEKDRVINKEFKSDCNDELHSPNFDICCTNSWCTRRELKIDEDSNQIEGLENTILDNGKIMNQMATEISQLKSQIKNK